MTCSRAYGSGRRHEKIEIIKIKKDNALSNSNKSNEIGKSLACYWSTFN